METLETKIDFLVCGNDPEAGSAAVLVPRLAIEALIIEEIDEYIFPIYLSEKLPDAHEEIIQVFGNPLNELAHEIEVSFDIDKVEDLKIKIQSYYTEISVFNDPNANIVSAYRSHFATCPAADKHRKRGS